MVHSDDQPRSCCKLGIVEQLIVGTDGQTRAANNKNGRTSALDRQIQHLYPLEIASPLHATLDNHDNAKNDSNVQQQVVNTSRPR